MPSPLTHLVYAQQYLERHARLDEAAFWRGSLFPDVRRLASIPREQTHRLDVTLEEVGQEPDAWRAGYLFHSLLDVAWNVQADKLARKLKMPMNSITGLALKLLEARRLRPKLKQLDMVQAAFHEAPYPQEVELVPAEVVMSWNLWIRENTEESFDLDAWMSKAMRVNFSEQEAIAIRNEALSLSENSKAQLFLQELTRNLAMEAAAS